MIIINTANVMTNNPIYIVKCPYCNGQFMAYLCSEYICPHCYTLIPDILGIINTPITKIYYYLNKKETE